MKKRLSARLGTLLLAGVLSLSALPAQAAVGYSDLPRDHWAYSSMNMAVGLGVMQGVGNNQLAPDQSLKWDQFLTLAARAFLPDQYKAALAAGQTWAQAGFSVCTEAGLVQPGDGLPAAAEELNIPITRQGAALVLYRALPQRLRERYDQSDMDPDLFTDFSQMSPLHQRAVYVLNQAGVVNGKDDGSFGRAELLRRCDGAVLLMRTLDKVDRDRSGEEKTVTVRYVDQETGKELQPARQTVAVVGQGLYALKGDSPQYYVFSNYGGVIDVSTACATYTFYYRPMTKLERLQSDFWDKVERGEANAEDYYIQPFWLSVEGENYAKRSLLFGDVNKRRFDSYAEAKAAMVTISVPIWKLSNGVKKSSTTTLTVHKAIADDVKEIFTEIYNDPEQFPINATSTFRYVEGTTGEHNCGTAIDLNANENYQVRDGIAMVGSFWKPGVSPYSIPENGSVVRIFAEHGWSWGGNAWAGHSDQTVDYHDYMHFSYMGG